MAVLVLFSLVATVFVVVLIGRLLLMRMFVRILARGMRVRVLVCVRVRVLVLVGVRMLVFRSVVRMLMLVLVLVGVLVFMFVRVIVIRFLAHGLPLSATAALQKTVRTTLRVAV